MRPAELLIVNAAELVTRADRDGLEVVPNGAVASAGGVVVAVGSTPEVESRVDARGAEVIDASGMTVLAGLVDAHTHLAFSGWREGEFYMRIGGSGYEEILASGGGILDTVRSTRRASAEELAELVRGRLDLLLKLGTTTVEVKSGYGLTTSDELKILVAIREAARGHPVEVVPTFLGAHAIPPEFEHDPDGYVDLVVEEMLPRVREEGLAEYADVFCGPGVFSTCQARRILERAAELGLGIRIHADELSESGGAELAAELRARSADHLLRPSEVGLRRLASSGTTAVLLPATAFFLMSGVFAPARRLIDLGVPVALATDFNPGTCTNPSLQLVMTLACLTMKMNAAEAIAGVTANAARSLGRADRIGTLEEGKQADIVAFDVPGHAHIPYRFGHAPVTFVVKRGKVVYERGVCCDRRP